VPLCAVSSLQIDKERNLVCFNDSNIFGLKVVQEMNMCRRLFTMVNRIKVQ